MKAHSIGSISLAFTATLVGLTTCLPAAAATFYNVLNLGTLSENPDNFSVARGLNDLGEVIGDSSNAFGNQAFRTAPNSPINPATDNIVGNQVPPSFANDINNLRQVVGDIAAQSRFSASFITEFDGAVQFLGTVNFNSINDSSQIAATGLVSDPNITSIFHAVRIDSDDSINARIDLGTLGGIRSDGIGINNSGQVVGNSQTTNGETHAFRTAGNSVINAATDDLGTLGGSSSTAFDINDLGQVIGTSTTVSGETRAFLTGANAAINAATDDLGTLGGDFSAAYGINESGLVVGSSSLADGTSRAFVYDGTALFDLNTLISADSGFVLTSARGINESGQIAATGFFADTQTNRAFLLTPVPEPTTMLGVLAFSAGAGLLRKRSTKQKLKA